MNVCIDVGGHGDAFQCLGNIVSNCIIRWARESDDAINGAPHRHPLAPPHYIVCVRRESRLINKRGERVPEQRSKLLLSCYLYIIRPTFRGFIVV